MSVTGNLTAAGVEGSHAACDARIGRLKALVAEILDAVEATTDRPGMQADIAIWRRRAGLAP